MKRLTDHLMAVILFVCVLVQAFVLTYAVVKTREQRAQIDAVNHFIYCAIERSEKTLPTIDYYRRHPGELAEQLASLAAQKRAFVPPPEPCVL